MLLVLWTCPSYFSSFSLSSGKRRQQRALIRTWNVTKTFGGGIGVGRESRSSKILSPPPCWLWVPLSRHENRHTSGPEAPALLLQFCTLGQVIFSLESLNKIWSIDHWWFPDYGHIEIWCYTTSKTEWHYSFISDSKLMGRIIFNLTFSFLCSPNTETAAVNKNSKHVIVLLGISKHSCFKKTRIHRLLVSKSARFQ